LNKNMKSYPFVNYVTMHSVRHLTAEVPKYSITQKKRKQKTINISKQR